MHSSLSLFPPASSFRAAVPRIVLETPCRAGIRNDAWRPSDPSSLTLRPTDRPRTPAAPPSLRARSNVSLPAADLHQTPSSQLAFARAAARRLWKRRGRHRLSLPTNAESVWLSLPARRD